MPIETKPWDPAEHLDTEEAVIAYLDAAFEDGDPALISAALADIARSRGIVPVARKAGLTPESIHPLLSAENNPQLESVIKIFRALGVRLNAKAA